MVSSLEFKGLELNGTSLRGNAELVLATREGNSYTAMAERRADDGQRNGELAAMKRNAKIQAAQGTSIPNRVTAPRCINQSSKLEVRGLGNYA